MISPYPTTAPRKTLYGKWSIVNDTLQIHLYEFSNSTLSSDAGQIIRKEKLSTPMTQKYSFHAIDEHNIEKLKLVNESNNWTLNRYIEEYYFPDEN